MKRLSYSAPAQAPLLPMWINLREAVQPANSPCFVAGGGGVSNTLGYYIMANSLNVFEALCLALGLQSDRHKMQGLPRCSQQSRHTGDVYRETIGEHLNGS